MDSGDEGVVGVGGYFKPLRRKVGILTLAFACGVMVIGLRSRTTFDFLAIPFGKADLIFASRASLFSFVRSTPPGGRFRWSSGDLSTVSDWFDSNGRMHIWKDYEIEWQYGWREFGVGAGNREQTRVESCTFPFWFLVVCMIVPAGWLLLSKPKQPNSVNSEQVT